jgi:hypothetical protein
LWVSLSKKDYECNEYRKRLKCIDVMIWKQKKGFIIDNCL